MANTYTQIHIQFVFVVKFRDCIIQDNWKDELYKYITGIIQNQNHKLEVNHSYKGRLLIATMIILLMHRIGKLSFENASTLFPKK